VLGVFSQTLSGKPQKNKGNP